MQEHPHFDQASQCAEKENTAGQTITCIFELLENMLRRRLNEGIQSRAHL